MATFTIDLLTGNVYLFSGDFGGSGSTPTSGSTYPEVNNFGELPTPASSYAGKVYLVRNSSGAFVLNRKEAGLYFSNGISWVRLGDIPAFFKSDNFQVYDNVDTSKGVKFNTSGITTGTFRTLSVQNSDGTIAYLTDIQGKVDLTLFNQFTGVTAPNTYLSITNFDVYSGQTLSLIQAKQDVLTAGKGIKIDGANVISADIPSTLQILDTVGGQNINNIQATAVDWTTEIYSGTSLSFTGGSRIYIEEDGVYGISYILNANNDTNSGKNIGTLIRKNGNEDITPMSSAAYNFNYQNDTSTNIMPEYHVDLDNGDYIELVGFRIGNSGTVYTVANSSWLKIMKII